MIHLTESQWSIIQLSLRIAADVFESDAGHADVAKSERLTRQFEKQRDEARQVLELLEERLPDGDTIVAAIQVSALFK